MRLSAKLEPGELALFNAGRCLQIRDRFMNDAHAAPPKGRTLYVVLARQAHSEMLRYVRIARLYLRSRRVA